jgi:transposase
LIGGDDHPCEWRESGERLEGQLETTLAELTSTRAEPSTMGEKVAGLTVSLEKLQRHVFGRRSEKMPPVAEAIRDPARAEADRVVPLQKRPENAEKKGQLVTRRIEDKVREDQKICPKCGGHDFTPLGGRVAPPQLDTATIPAVGLTRSAASLNRKRGLTVPPECP